MNIQLGVVNMEMVDIFTDLVTYMYSVLMALENDPTAVTFISM